MRRRRRLGLVGLLGAVAMLAAAAVSAAPDPSRHRGPTTGNSFFTGGGGAGDFGPKHPGQGK